MLHNLVSLVVILKYLNKIYFITQFNEEANVMNVFEFVREKK